MENAGGTNTQVPPPRFLPAPSPWCPQQQDAHVHEEELHLQLSDPAPQALAGSKTKTQPLEVLGAGCQPALGAKLLRLGEDLGIPAHGVETDLYQCLRGRFSPVGLGSPQGLASTQGARRGCRAGIQPQMSPTAAPRPVTPPCTRSHLHPEPRVKRVRVRRVPAAMLTLGGMR